MEDYEKICCLGIAIDTKCEQVVLVKKDRPEEQAGCYNFPGGKLSVNEHPRDAMRREFKEETGVWIETWLPVCRKEDSGFTIYCYAALTDDLWMVEQQEGETEVPEVIPIEEFMRMPHKDMVNGPSLHFLFDQALFKVATNQSWFRNPMQ